MNRPTFSWLSDSTDEYKPSGTARFAHGDTVLLVRFDDFAVAHQVASMIQRAYDRGALDGVEMLEDSLRIDMRVTVANTKRRLL